MPSEHTRRIPVDSLSRGQDEPTVVVLGGEAAKGLATHLAETYDAVMVSDDPEVVRKAERDGIDSAEADITAGSELADHACDAEAAVVAAERDRVSLLAAQLLRTVCGIDDVAVLLNDPGNRDLFADIDVEVLEDRTVLGRELERTLFDEPP